MSRKYELDYGPSEVNCANVGLPKMFGWVWAWTVDDTGLRIYVQIDKGDVIMRCGGF